jgi:hypothetical protein
MLKTFLMQSLRYLLLMGVLLVFAAGCKKSLDERVYDFYSPNNLYKTPADAEAAITGLYGYLHSWDFFKSPALFTEDVDHDHIVGPLWNMGGVGAGNFAGSFGINGLWHGYYYLISQVNTILENVPAIKIEPDSTKNRILGEAYFFRGWSYFNLVRLWGAVPIRLQNPATGSLDMARSSVEEVYQQAIADLKEAEQLLPPKGGAFTGAIGKVTKGTAKAMLAKVYLTMASGALSGAQLIVRGGPDNAEYTYSKDLVKGYENINSKALFTQARDKALEVIQSKEYELTPTFMGLWGRANKNNKELLWELQTMDNNDYGTLLQYYYSAPWFGGTSYYWMSNNLYNSHKEKDTRILDGIFHQYFMYGAWMLFPERDSLKYKQAPGGYTAQFYPAYSHPFPKKYWIGTDTEIGDNGTTVRTGNRDCNFPLLRYADVLLIFAEAENEAADGPTPRAYDALNQVRVRSKEDPADGLSQLQFRSMVFDERGKELYQEGNRRFDLIRWGVYLQVMNKLSTIENVIKTRESKNLLFPIPQDELNANKLLKENNPGW